MKYEIYCDEVHPEVFTSANPTAQYLMIGSLWVPAELRGQIKQRIGDLRQQYQTWGEIKWSKVSPSRQNFYLALINLFLDYDKELRFRCIAVDRHQVNLELHENDAELGFYKFYYQLLHHWILDFNEYSVFCDAKSNRNPKRLPVLQSCLARASLSSTIAGVQSLPSREVVLIQLCDLLLGAASSRLNDTLHADTAKHALVQALEAGLRRRLSPTHKTEEKFNIFRIQLQGGW